MLMGGVLGTFLLGFICSGLRTCFAAELVCLCDRAGSI